METSSSSSSRAMVQALFLVLAVQVTLAQHWSYGWLPGGKRSVGELEATIRVQTTACSTRHLHLYLHLPLSEGG